MLNTFILRVFYEAVCHLIVIFSSISPRLQRRHCLETGKIARRAIGEKNGGDERST